MTDSRHRQLSRIFQRKIEDDEHARAAISADPGVLASALFLEAVESDDVTSVEGALGYLADVYGYEVAGTVIPAGTTLAEPSSADLAELVAVMRDEGVDVIFANTANPTALAEAVAGEVGGNTQVVSLFVESLGEPGSGAEDYISMMRTNAELISGALTARS